MKTELLLALGRFPTGLFVVCTARDKFYCRSNQMGSFGEESGRQTHQRQTYLGYNSNEKVAEGPSKLP